MKLFISYSRDDKAWVYELWRALRDRTYHNAWIDQQLVPAQDWWETILQNIENCECCIYVMTPKAVESIYCAAELNYALALNKPVIPLMLKSCDIPGEIKKRRIQYSTISDGDSLGDVLFVIERALSEVRVGLIQGKYPSPQRVPIHPDEPTPDKRPEHISEVFMLAEEAAYANNTSLAEKLFQQVIDTDPQGYGLAAAERLAEIRYERTRNADYLNIVQKANNPALRKGALALWKVFRQKYGADYDPNDLAALLTEKIVTPLPKPQEAAKPAAPAVIKRDPILDILPQPFAWIEIPAGKVTLVEQYREKSYFGERDERKTFNVPTFAIAKYPITNAQFAKFIEAGGYNQNKWWTDAGWKVRERGKWTQPHYWTDANFNQPDHPVVGVSWYECIAFCRWLSEITGDQITLPTEQQWQRAAQGDSNRMFPWGDRFDKRRCNYDSGRTTPVTQYEGKGDSPFGVVDLSGNVREWCLTEYDSGSHEINSTNARVLRGGSWSEFFEIDLRTDYRAYKYPHVRDNHFGFRLVRSAE